MCFVPQRHNPMCFVPFSSLDEHVTTRPVQLRLYLEDGAFRFQAVRLDDIGLMTDLTGLFHSLPIICLALSSLHQGQPRATGTYFHDQYLLGKYKISSTKLAGNSFVQLTPLRLQLRPTQ